MMPAASDAGGRASREPAGTSAGVSTALGETLERLARDGASHVAGAPASEHDIRQLENGLRRPLPASMRALLSRFGGGLFYEGHEIFGPHPVVIHDIELVPSLPAMLARLRGGGGLPEGMFPLHRTGGLIHLVDTRDAAQPERVVSLPSGSTYPDLATFLRMVVRRAAPGALRA
jgi:hypothetical protein